jgi:hypothetical protein
LEGIANGGALGDRGELLVLVEEALGWPMLADMIEMDEFDQQ